MRKIGVLYLNGSYFVDEAAKTMGQPALTGEVIANRRSVTARLTDLGKQWKQRTIEWFKETFDVEIKLRWSIHAGCSMCPCSPGFNIMVVDKTKVIGPRTIRRWSSSLKKMRTYENEINIWVEADGSFKPHLPEVPLLKTMDKPAEVAG